MINPLALIPKSAYAVVIVALTITSGGLYWNLSKEKLKSANLEVAVAEEKVKVADLKVAIADANTLAANQSKELTNKVLEAQNAAKKREAVLLADAKSANAALDGLRLSIAASKSTYSLANIPTHASTELADTALTLLAHCAERYTAVSADADQYVSYIQEVTQAWPVLPVPVKSAPPP